MFFSFGNGFGFSRQGGGSAYEDLLPSLSFGVSSYDYGEHDTSTNTDYIFTLTNSGNEVAEDITVAVTGTGFSLLSSAGPFNIAADGGYVSITVRFAPSGAGEVTGALTVSWPNQDDIVVTLAGEGIATTTYFVNDDFSTDTLSNYIQLNSSVAMTYDSTGQRLAASNSGRSGVVYSTPANTTSYAVQGKLHLVNSAAGTHTALVFGCNGSGGTSTGYYLYPTASNLAYRTFSNGLGVTTYVGSKNFVGGKTWVEGVSHLLRVVVSGNIFALYVDWDDDGDFNDADEYLGTITNSTYSGLYVGLAGYGSGTTAYADNLKGENI